MNAVVQGALIGGGFGFLGLTANLMYNYLSRRQERVEEYRIALYAKRLEVHQQAFKWLMDLFEPMAWAQKSPGGDPGYLLTLKGLNTDAQAWWNANCLYLDDDSRQRTEDFIRLAHEMSHGVVPDLGELLGNFHETLRSIQEGIGAKHLDIKEPQVGA